MKSETQMLTVQSKMAPVIVVDNQANAVYIYFNRGKVAKTIARSTRGSILNIDLDAHGEVVGIEAVGASEIQLDKIMERAHVRAPQIDWSHARWRSTDLQMA